MAPDPEQFDTGYTLAEALALVAPLVGVAPKHIDGYLLVGINTKKSCGHIGGSENIPIWVVPTILRVLADQVERGPGQTKFNIN